MKSEFPPLPPARTPQECADWITPQEVAAHAQAAYEWACARMHPEPGCPFMDADDQPWADRETLAECISHFFDLRIKATAHRLSVGRFCQQVDMLARCESATPETIN